MPIKENHWWSVLWTDSLKKAWECGLEGKDPISSSRENEAKERRRGNSLVNPPADNCKCKGFEDFQEEHSVQAVPQINLSIEIQLQSHSLLLCCDSLLCRWVVVLWFCIAFYFLCFCSWAFSFLEKVTVSCSPNFSILPFPMDGYFI